MHINVEIQDATRVYVHDLKPLIKNLNPDKGRDALYVLCDRNHEIPTDKHSSLSVFLHIHELQTLYAQLKAILEPDELLVTSSSTCLTT